jgi:hypothetical protein
MPPIPTTVNNGLLAHPDRLDHSWQVIGVILQIRVLNNDNRSGNVGDSCSNSGSLTAILSMSYQLNATRLRPPGQNLGSAIGAPIVNDDDFLVGIRTIGESRQQSINRSFFIENRNDH